MKDEGMNILVIEDDEVDTLAIRRAVNNMSTPVRLHIARKGEEGIAALATQGPFDCIFLDYMLPGMNGLELLRKFRQKDKDIPIVVVTSKGDENIAVKMMKEGATDYIPKNLITPDRISQVIRTSLRLAEKEMQHRRAEKKLREKEAQLNLVVESTPIILFAVDSDGKILLLKGAKAGITGLPPDKTIGMDFIEVFGDEQQFHDTYSRAMQGETFTTQIDYNGLCFDAFVKPLRDEHNQISGLMGVCVDVTVHKQAETQLQKAKELAEYSARMKEEFLANMSHEIRTPMNAILGFAQLLKNSSLNPEQENYVRNICFAGDTLTAVIDDILDISKIEAGKLDLEHKPFRIKELISSLVSIFKPRAAEKNLRLVLLSDDALPDVVEGDPIRLNQILMNLIGNAMKFTENGSITVMTEALSVQGGTVQVKFIVKDTGIGIAPEKHTSIFESFTQASTDTARRFGGTGLGLTICKKLTDLQGGTIGVNSTPGKGSEFWFTLPYQISSAEAESVHAEPEISSFRKHPGIRILLVEDNVLNQQLARKVLEQFGFDITLAENGRAALDRLGSGHFDLVLMDVQMPVMDGYETTRRIRAELTEPARSIPILALTAHAISEETNRCREAGMDDITTKPLNPEILYNKILGLIEKGKRQMTREQNAHAESGTYQYVSLGYLRDVSTGNSDFTRELIEMFLDNTPESLAHLQENLDAGDFETLCRIAHTLKPSFQIFGIQKGVELLAMIETEGRNRSGKEIPGLIKRVVDLFLLASAELRSFLELLA